MDIAMFSAGLDVQFAVIGVKSINYLPAVPSLSEQVGLGLLLNAIWCELFVVWSQAKLLICKYHFS